MRMILVLSINLNNAHDLEHCSFSFSSRYLRYTALVASASAIASSIVSPPPTHPFKSGYSTHHSAFPFSKCTGYTFIA